MKKLIALIGAVVAAATTAWAADLLVSWEGDFKTASKVGTDGKTYTLALNDNTVAEDGSTLTVSQTKAPTITLPSEMGQHISVVMKYSGYTTPSSRTAFLSLSPSGCNDVGLTATSEKLSGFWNNNGTEYGPQTMTAPASGLAVLSYSCSTDNKGTFGYIGTINADGTISYSGRIGAANLRFTKDSYNMDGKTVNLGGVTNTNSHPSMQNLVIEKVAVFSGLFEANNDATLTGFVWPNYQRWAANPAVLTWADTVSGTQAFHEGPWNLFSIKGGADTTTSYTTTAAQLPGQTANITPWNAFSSTSGYKYVAPGYVLRLTPGYSAGNLNASFTDLTFGGLIVEKGATGYEFNSDGTRQTALGDNRASNGVDTWYEIHENLRFHRQGAFTLYGALNFDIDAGKTLDLNSARTGQTLTLNAASHAALKLHGAGNLKVYNLNASGAVTLDYTDVDLSRNDAYVTGTITLGTATTIKLPAMEVAVGTTVKLATTLAGSIDTTKVLVDGAANENILWTIDGGRLMATQAPDVVTIGEDGYVSLRQALAAAQSGDTLTLGADLVGKGETVAAGVTIDLAGHALTGTLDIKAGALIKDGDTVKIDGIATSFDATFNDPQNPTVFKFKEESGVTLQYDTVDGRGTPLFQHEDPISKETGITLKNHPYFNNIPAAWFNNTLELTLAVVGTMTEATRTTFIHMGSSNGAASRGLLLATGDKKDEVIVAWNSGTTVNVITRMQVPNAATSRHVYIVTKKDDPETNKTTFTVYLDNIKWKTLVVDKFTIVGGVQVGSDFSGQIYRYGTGDNLYHNVTEDVGLINAIRLYDRVISAEEIAQYSVAEEYPYVSPNGASTRTVAGEADWIAETTEWSNTAAGETTAVAATEPLAGAIDLTASEETTITVNLDADATCEMLTLKGSAMTFVAEGEGSLAPAAATIGVPVTVVPGSLDLSKANTTIVGDGAIIADYATMDLSQVFTTTTIYVTGEIDEQTDGVVTLVKPTTAGRTIGDLVYDETTHQYGFTVTPDSVNVTVTPVANMTATVAAGSIACPVTDGVAAVPYGATITVTYAPVAGYHTVEEAVTTVTIATVTEEQAVDVSVITPVAINVYNVKVMVKENSIAHVLVAGEAFGDYTEETTIQMNHGQRFDVSYTAAEGYTLTGTTSGYYYGAVTSDKGDYTLNFTVARIVPTATVAEMAAEDMPAEPKLDSAYVFTTGTYGATFADWHADFEVTFDDEIAADTVMLYGQYGTYEWTGFYLGAMTSTSKVYLMEKYDANLTCAEVFDNVGVFKCGVINTAAANAGKTMTVKLVLSKDGEEPIVVATQAYTLAEPPKPAVDFADPETITAETTAAELGLTNTAFMSDDGTTLKAVAEWAKAQGTSLDALNAIEATVAGDAYLLNVAPDADEVRDAKDAFAFDATDLAALMADPTAKPTIGTGDYNGAVKILGAETVDGEYSENNENAKFFKATLTK